MESNPQNDPIDNSKLEEFDRMLGETIENLNQEDQEEIVLKTVTETNLNQDVTPDNPEIKKNPNYKKIVFAIGGLAAALTVTIASIFGAGASKKSTNNTLIETESVAPSTEPNEIIQTTEQSVETSIISEIAEIEVPSVSEIEISAELISNPKELMDKYHSTLSTWLNEGSNVNHQNAALKSKYSLMDYGEIVSDAYKNNYTDALFAEGWENNNNLSNYIDRILEVHKITLALFYRTNNQPGNQEGYMREMNTVEIIYYTNIDGKITIQALVQETDNSDKNKSKEYVIGGSPITSGGEPKIVTYHFLVKDNAVKLFDRD
jgi:hypothetical protein